MFPEIITETEITEHGSSLIFPNIPRFMCYDDLSLTATLRVLLHERMDKDEVLTLSIQNWDSYYGSANIIGYTVDPQIHNFFHIVDIRSSSDKIEDFFKTLPVEFFKHPDMKTGWERVERVSDFYRKHFYADCYINTTTRSTIVFANNINSSKYHFLQCGIPIFMPWFFEGEKRLTEKETELIKSLSETSFVKYRKLISEFSQKFNFRELKIKNTLKDYETNVEKNQMIKLEDQIRRFQSEVNVLLADLSKTIALKQDSEACLFSIKYKIENLELESELMDYFLCNNNLHIERENQYGVIFGVTTNIEYFDIDMAERIISNKSSYLYANANYYDIPIEDLKGLFTSIFLDQDIKIRTCAAFLLGSSGIASAVPMFDLFYSEFGVYNNRIPNTHIDNYQCLGTNASLIAEMANLRNYIGVVEQCISSAKGLNLGDDIAASSFISNLIKHQNYKSLILPNGDLVTPIEAIEWVKEKEM